MRIKRLLKTLLATACVAGLLLCTMEGLERLVGMQDAAMLQKTHMRTIHVDELSQKAEHIDIVRALWEGENFYEGNLFYDSLTGESMKERPITVEQVEKLYTDLGEAGVIPPKALAWALREVTKDYARSYMPVKAEFCALYTAHANAQVWRDTLVTSVNVYCEEENIASAMDWAECIHNYAVYLGVDTFDDWVNIPIQGEQKRQGMSVYSAQAQLYLTVSAEKNTFACGAYSVAPQVMAQRGAQGGAQ